MFFSISGASLKRSEPHRRTSTANSHPKNSNGYGKFNSGSKHVVLIPATTLPFRLDDRQLDVLGVRKTA
jgi:hypothetical protein